MSKGKRYTEEFKIEAVKQVTERGYSVQDVAERLGVTTKSLYYWKSKFSDNKTTHKKTSDDSVRIAKLEAELKRVTEERDILKNVWSAAICQRILLLIDYVGQHKCIRTVCELFLLGSVHDEDPRTSSLKRPMSF